MSLTPVLTFGQIIENIAFLLEDDRDLINLSLTCALMKATLLSDKSSIWRRRFKEKYDLPRDKSSTQIKLEYQIRSIILSRAVSFKDGEGDQQKLWLDVIQLLLQESLSAYKGDHKDSSESKSLTRISAAVSKSSFLKRPVSGFAIRSQDLCSDSFCTVQLVRPECLNHLHFT